MKKDKLVLWSVLAIILLVFFWGIDRWASILKKEDQIKAKKEAELKQTQITFDNLESSKLFGIKLGDSAISLILQLKYHGTPLYKEVWTSEDYEKIMDPSGLLTGTKINFLSMGEFAIRLNDFFRLTASDELFINKNDDFLDYYIKYQPYGDAKITSIIASLKTANTDHDQCIKDLRPYASVITERIKKENPDQHIIIEDKFFPKIEGQHNHAQILFKYKKAKSYLDGKRALRLDGWCWGSKRHPFIELSAPGLRIELKTYQQILKKIKDQKELDLKNEFNENANEDKTKIDKSGL